uniref:Uncharacterized protein n=1 Tax=Rhizophagus irregularis (strain DAOM 181602 / DAOM 197198 / MUCL 43194) TaxID=747089 RepID=U9SZ96_RHIID
MRVLMDQVHLKHKNLKNTKQDLWEKFHEKYPSGVKRTTNSFKITLVIFISR